MRRSHTVDNRGISNSESSSDSIKPDSLNYWDASLELSLVKQTALVNPILINKLVYQNIYLVRANQTVESERDWQAFQ